MKRKERDEKIMEQARFVRTLTDVLVEDIIREDPEYTLSLGMFPFHTRYQNDIIRIRRELNKLSKLLGRYE